MRLFVSYIYEIVISPGKDGRCILSKRRVLLFINDGKCFNNMYQTM